MQVIDNSINSKLNEHRRSNLKIGFDMDGVICTHDESFLRLIQLVADDKDIEELYRYYYKSRRLLLNPNNFLGPYDIGIIITGRCETYSDITEEWLARYKLDSLPIVYAGRIDLKKGIDINCFYNEIAERKCKIIKHNDLNVFFEDNQIIIDYLRKHCPECKIICVNN